MDEAAKLYAECINNPVCRNLMDPQPYWVFGLNLITLIVCVAILILIVIWRR